MPRRFQYQSANAAFQRACYSNKQYNVGLLNEDKVLGNETVTGAM